MKPCGGSTSLRSLLVKASSLLILLGACEALAQGTFYYDQQSSTDESPFPFSAGGAIQSATFPWGQSFTPTNSAINFIRLNTLDGSLADGKGATLYIELRSNISGSLIGVTAPVTLMTGFNGVTNFYFPNEIPLNPGNLYYFTPVVQSGGFWNIIGGESPYPGGKAYNNGVFAAQSDLWFREGLFVPTPEPAGSLLLLVGATILFAARSKRGRCT